MEDLLPLTFPQKHAYLYILNVILVCFHLLYFSKYYVLIVGEAVHVQRKGVCGRSLYLPLDFAVSLKLF